MVKDVRPEFEKFTPSLWCAASAVVTSVHGIEGPG